MAARTIILSILVITTAASLWCVSSSSDEAAAAASFVKKTISSHKIVIFSKSYCPYSLSLPLSSIFPSSLLLLLFIIWRSSIYLWFHWIFNCLNTYICLSLLFIYLLKLLSLRFYGLQFIFVISLKFVYLFSLNALTDRPRINN